MKRLPVALFAMLGALSFSVEASHAVIIGGPVTNPANGHQYVLLSENNWTDSEAEAVELGGHLATVNDAAENAWITSTFSASLYSAAAYYLWIGLNDAAVEGQFVWSSGETASYRNWFPGEPNNKRRREHYVQIYNFPTGNQQWNDMENVDGDKDFFFHGVVELVPVPEPGTVLLLLAGLGGAMLVRRSRRREVART